MRRAAHKGIEEESAIHRCSSLTQHGCAGLSPCSDLVGLVIVLADFAITDAATAHVTERDEPPPTFIPKHKTHAAKTLKERESACSNKLGLFAQRVG